MACCRGSLYLFGGYNGKEHLGDLHVFDLQSRRWRELPLREPKPCPRRGGTMVEFRGKLYLLGGAASMRGFDDVWCFDPDSGRWECLLHTGAGLFRHSAVVHEDCMLVFGGVLKGGSSSQLFCFDFPGVRGSGASGRWRELAAQGECPGLNSHEAVRLGELMVVWGGISEQGAHNTDCFCLHLPSRTWSRSSPSFLSSPSPQGRCFFGLGVLYDTIVMTLGRHDRVDPTGRLEMTYFDDLWALNIS